MKINNSEKNIKIGGRLIGREYPSFIVAEVSGNHHQKYEEAQDIIKTAARAGVDAVKLQTYTPDTLTINSDRPWFLVDSADTPSEWNKKKLYDLYQSAYTPWEWQPKLKRLAESLGLILFSTPFDETAVDFLEDMKVPCYKVASYEANHIPLLKKIAKTKKPVIMSVGFSYTKDIDLALETLRESGCKQIAILHCVTSYSDQPSIDDINLQTIVDIRDRFGVASGFSDNNGGIEIPIIAANIGASIIEKHVTLRRRDGGPDARFSIEPDELKEMVNRIRRAERIIGKVKYGPANNAEKYNGKKFSQSVFVVKKVEKGEKFTKKNARCIRPGDGLAPKYYEFILGKTANCDIDAGTPLSWKLVKK